MAQVQSLVRSQQPPTPTSNHHPSFTDKLVEDAIFTSPSSPPHGATVNQLLRRAALQHRRDRRIPSDPDGGEHGKRVRSEHIIGNNNNEINLTTTHTQPPQTHPADFSPSAMKNSPLNLNASIMNAHKHEIEGNGISSTDREASPCSPSPTLNSRWVWLSKIPHSWGKRLTGEIKNSRGVVKFIENSLDLQIFQTLLILQDERRHQV